VLTKWFGVQLRLAKSTAWEGEVPLEELLELTGFGAGLTNASSGDATLPALQKHVPAAVERAREHALDAYKQALPELRQQVRAASRRLDRWKRHRLQALDAREQRSRARNNGKLPVIFERRLQEQRGHVESFSNDHAQWIQGVVRHGDPYIRLAAVFSGESR